MKKYEPFCNECGKELRQNTIKSHLRDEHNITYNVDKYIYFAEVNKK